MGAARTSDPLGGSYYVEDLTDAIETQATTDQGTEKLVDVIERHENHRAGMAAPRRNGVPTRSMNKP